jgi:hypothetical protein
MHGELESSSKMIFRTKTFWGFAVMALVYEGAASTTSSSFPERPAYSYTLEELKYWNGSQLYNLHRAHRFSSFGMLLVEPRGRSAFELSAN